MAIDPSDIDPEQQRLLEERARQTGRTEAELLREALAAYFVGDAPSVSAWMKAQEQSFSNVWNNEEDSVFDAM